MLAWWRRRSQHRLMLELERAIDLEVMLLVEGGQLAAECQDEAIRTALPIAVDAFLTRGAHSLDFTDRHVRTLCRQLVMAMTCACPWWLPTKMRQRIPQRRRAQNAAADRNLPTTEFVGALWKINPSLIRVEQVSWAFAYYTRFCLSPGSLDLDLVRESAEWSTGSVRKPYGDRTLDHPQASAIRTAMLERGGPGRLRVTVAYFERFRRESGATESELIAESILWALDDELRRLDDDQGLPYTGPLSRAQMSTFWTALQAHGATGRLRVAVAYFERFRRESGATESELIAESILWALDDRSGRPYTGHPPA